MVTLGFVAWLLISVFHIINQFAVRESKNLFSDITQINKYLLSLYTALTQMLLASDCFSVLCWCFFSLKVVIISLLIHCIPITSSSPNFQELLDVIFLKENHLWFSISSNLFFPPKQALNSHLGELFPIPATLISLKISLLSSLTFLLPFF